MSADWPKVALDELLTLVSRPENVEPDKTYHILGAHWYAEGLYTKEIKEGSQIRAKKLYRVEEGDFVYNRLFAWKGSFALATEKNDGCYVSNEFPSFSIERERTDGRYLWRYFSRASAWNEALGLSSGGTPTSRNRLKVEKFLAMKIPLPPLDEQRRIVARIEELAAKIEEAQKLQRQSAVEAEALFAAATRYMFDSKSSSMVTIEELVGKKNLKNGLSIRATDEESQTRCLRLSALRDGKIDCADSKPIPLNEKEAAPYLIEDKDVFVVRGNGSKRLVGRAGMVEENIPGTIFPDLFIRVPLDKNQIIPEFFVAWWNSQKMRDLIEETAKTTSGIWKVNQGHIASFSIPILSLPEQRRIVAHLDELQAKVDALKKLQAGAGEELDALLPSVLDRAFKGEL